MKIGVLGPEGSYSEMAARRWKADAGLAYYPDFEDVLLAVLSEQVDYGVVPLENSLEGAVGLTMDLLLNLAVRIVGEVNVPVRHCLMGRGGSEIKVILSHPQALAQCRKYIKRHYPGAEVRSTGSTSHAARLAQEFPEMAAIAGAGTADKYGLQVIARDIQDSRENITRFAVAGLDETTPSGRDRTSLVVYLERDRPGALYEILHEFASRGINLTRIESRPSRRCLGDYYFYIDIEGHSSDAVIRGALEGVLEKASMMKVLGSYPRA